MANTLKAAAPTTSGDVTEAANSADEEQAALELIRNTAPSEQQQARIAEARKRVEARGERFQTRVLKSEPGAATAVAPPHNDQAGYGEHEKDAFGTSSAAFSSAMYAELATISGLSRGLTDENGLNAALAVVDGARPNNEIEAQLVVQMASTHLVAMDVLSRSKFASTVEGKELYGNLAIKFLRTYTAQMEALAKFRRGPQVVEVRHVHVYPGGKAIVGEVHQHAHGGVGAGDENQRQPHELSLGYAPGVTMRGAEPRGDAVPVTSNEGQASVSPPRRSTGQRST